MLHIPSGQQNFQLIWTLNSSLLEWLTVISGAMNNRLGKKNVVLTQNVTHLQQDSFAIKHVEGESFQCGNFPAWLCHDLVSSDSRAVDRPGDLHSCPTLLTS